MSQIQSHRLARSEHTPEVNSEFGPEHSASGGSAMAQNAGSSNSPTTDQFEKPNRTFIQKDFRDTPKYHDVESYTTQRHHYIGTGVFNADNIEDLPPRYRTKVLNAFEWLAATFPQSNMTASDLLALNPHPSGKKPPSNSSFEPQRSQNSRGRHENLRGNHNRPSSDRNLSNCHESSSHSSNINQGSLNRNNSQRGSRSDTPRASSIESSTSSRYSDQERIECNSNSRNVPSSNSQSFSQAYHGIPSRSQRTNTHNLFSTKETETGEGCNSSSDHLVQIPNSTNSCDIPSVRSGERFPPAPELDKNIPNVHSKQNSQTKNFVQNTLPSNKNFRSCNSQGEENRKTNTLKSINNQNHNKVSDTNRTFVAKGGANTTQNKRDQNYSSNCEDFTYASDNDNTHNQNQTSSQTPLESGNKRFSNNKRNRNFVSSAQSSNTVQDRKSEPLSINSQTSLKNTPNDKSDLNFYNKNYSGDQRLDSPYFSSKNSGKGRNSNRSQQNKIDGEPTNVNNSARSQSQSSFNDDRTFLSREENQGSYGASNTRAPNGPLRNSTKKDVTESVLEIISKREKEFKVPCNQEKVAGKSGSQNSTRTNSKCNERVNPNISERYIDEGKANHNNQSSRYNGRRKPLKSSDCESNFYGNNKYNRPDSRNSSSSECFADRSVSEDFCKRSISPNPSQSNNSKTHSRNDFGRPSSQNSVSSEPRMPTSGKNTRSNPRGNINYEDEDCDTRRVNFRDKKTGKRANSQFSVSNDRFPDERFSANGHKNTNMSDYQSNATSNATSSRDFDNRQNSRNTTRDTKFNNPRSFEDRKQTKKAGSCNSENFNSDVSESSFSSTLKHGNETNKENRISERLEIIPKNNRNKCEEKGFFVSVNVSDGSGEEKDWKKFLSNALKHNKFSLDSCCKFSDKKILSFEDKYLALEASSTLKKMKQRKIVLGEPHLSLVGNLKYRLIRPCNCQDKMVQDCVVYLHEFSQDYIQEHQSKIVDIEEELKSLRKGGGGKFLKEQERVLKHSLIMLGDIERDFQIYINNLKMELRNKAPNFSHICKLKSNFMRECQSFQRCLPIYSRKEDILNRVRYFPVTVISAETGSGKSTQLAEYLLQSWIAERGTIICTQPRKIAAISITNYVCGKIGSAVGKLIGYDVGTEKKFDKNTKIIYMTDYALLRKFLRNRRLKGISCVIIDEAHERTLHTDLLLGMLKQCLKVVNDRQDLRVVITSATIDPSVFVRYFNIREEAVIDVPGRAYPVEIVWLDYDVEVGWKYLEACVKTAVKIHTDEPKGDILVFLTSPSEIDEAILMFKDMYSNSEMPKLMSLHGKSDLQEQMRIFEVSSNATRRIIFATNAAETSLTIPGIKYVIDCGMAKEMSFLPAKGKNCLIMNFINKSSAEQRKGRAGRTQPGVCYRMYSKKNFRDMLDRASPEILRTSLQSALLKLYELGIDPHTFDFIESPSIESIAKSLESLELLDLVKGEQLTDMGRKVVELDIEPRLAKLVLQGIEAGIGYEMIIIAAMVREAGRLFIRSDDIKVLADQKKLTFCQENGDLYTYLEVYKRYREIEQNERYNWCVENFISSKALSSAEKTIKDIIVCLHLELSTRVPRRYNNKDFELHFKNILFNSFSENLCVYSGHPKVGYFSVILNDSLYIHPSSSLYYLGKDLPQFLVYSTLMQTTQNFLMDVTPITEDVVNKSYDKGNFQLSAHALKSIRVLPLTMGPYGDIVIKNHIIGKGGSKIVNLQVMIEKLTNSRNFKIEVKRNKGTIFIYTEGRFHEKLAQRIKNIVQEAHSNLAKEEDIVKMTEGFFYICIGSGGIVNDVIMPGEFREITIENIREYQVNDVENCLKTLGNLKNIRMKKLGKAKMYEIAATYLKVTDATEAKQKLSQMNLNVKSNIFVQENNGRELPIYRINVSWSRALSDGTGWVEFDSEAECIGASSCLSTNSFTIGHNYIRFAPSSSSVKHLEIRNLPPIIEEAVIEENLKSLLPPLIKVKTVFIKRKKLFPVTNNNHQQVQEKLAKEFGRFAPPSKMIVDVKCPGSGEPMWRALVYFENSEDGERAFRELRGKLSIDSVPVQLNAIRKSHLFCKSQVFRAVQPEIEQLKVQYPRTIFSFTPTGSMVDVGFSCKTVEDLFDVQQKLLRLFQGLTIQGFGDKKLAHLFTVRGHQLISKIEKQTKTVITVDSVRKIISIYGPKENCVKAKEGIRLLVEQEVASKKKVFDLKNSCMPNGFLKCLYIKYGFDLQGLICDFGLKTAVLDAIKGTLTIEGLGEKISQVEAHLEKICTDLYNKHQTVKLQDDKEVCAICLDPLSIDFYRLENCGHAYCKECLLFQVESNSIPLVCVKKDCGKLFFVVDIRTLLSRGDENLKKSFCNAVLQNHVTSNLGKISYCPVPDCNMVYRVSNVEAKHHCGGCQNTICTRCHTPYHYGMSCDMFKRCIEDADYSLKVWMEENSHLRKRCPQCQAVIEKDSGCNHMECLNCKAHMCWLCLKVFPIGDEVYEHLPYCPNNQGQ